MNKLVIFVVLVSATYCAAIPTDDELDQQDPLDAMYSGSKSILGQAVYSDGRFVVDPKLIHQAAVEHLDDIEEDPNDRFITSRSGKRRAILSDDPDADEWTNETPKSKLLEASTMGKVLSRKKRCNDDDDGDSNRARRARRGGRTRRTRRRGRTSRRTRKSAERAPQSTATTSVTKKVIKNGQVVSQTTETMVQQQVVISQQQSVQQPPIVRAVLQPQQPVVQAVAQPQQPMVVQPVVQPAAQQVVPSQNVPSIAVQGSIKVN